MSKKLLFRLAVLMAAMMCALGIHAQEAYACYTPSNTTLTFYYDTQRSSHEVGGRTYDLNMGSNYPGWNTDNTYTRVTSVVFDESFASASPTTTFAWFDGMSNLESISGMNLFLNTSKVKNMEWMFHLCTKLTSIDVSHFNTAKVTNMCSMFRECYGLTSLDLSRFNTSEVKDMRSMFNGCSDLTTIYVGSEWSTAAVTVSEEMFRNCTSLVGSEGTTYDDNHVNAEYAHIDGGSFSPGYLSELPEEVYVEYTPDNLILTFYYDNQRRYRTGTTYDLNTGSNNPAWYDDGTNSSITQVVFDRSFAYACPTTTYAWFMDMTNLQTITGLNYLKTENVTNMARMFSGCSSLTRLNIGDFNTANVANMDYMFNGSSGLVSVTLPQGLTSVSQYAFNDCSSLTAITLPAGITSIGSYAFNGCSSLESITLPSSVTSISDYAFSRCTSLTGIDIPENVTIIGSYAFYNSSNLKKVFVHWTTPIHVESSAFPFRSNEWLYVPEGTREAYKAANVWKDFKLIREDGYYHPFIVFFDDNVEAICLENFDIDGDGKLQKDEADMVTSIGTVFKGNTEIQTFNELRFFTGLTSTYVNAFDGCSNLTSITLPDGLTSISNFAFRNCTALTSVILPETLNYILVSAFAGCNSLTAIDLPEGLTAIGQNAFANCSSLNFMDIPSTVTTIGGGAFYGCTKLRAFGVHWTSPITADASSFPNRTNQGLYVPEGKKATYQAADVWQDFKWILEPDDSETYVIYNETDSTLTFYNDGLKPTRPGTAYSLNTGTTSPSWQIKRSGVAHVIFDESFAAVRPTTTYDWFNGMSNLKDITGLDLLNTSEVTNMRRMFYLCSKLTSLDLSKFNTGNVTDMGSMFNSCNALENLDVSNFDTRNVTDMSSMFSGCKLLTSLDVYSFDTRKVTDMSAMFSGCAGLTSLEVNCLDTRKVTNMSSMFYGCKLLTSLDVTELITSKVTRMNAMFQNCSGLTSLDLTKFNTSLVTDMQAMFTGCTGLTELDLSSFDTHNVTNMYYMFGGGTLGTIPCTNLVTIYVGDGWSTAAVTSSSGMFQGCTSIVGGKGTTYDASHVDATYAHVDGGTSNPGYFTDPNAPTAYACYTPENTTLTFYYDNQRSSRTGTTYGLNTGNNKPGW